MSVLVESSISSTQGHIKSEKTGYRARKPSSPTDTDTLHSEDVSLLQEACSKEMLGANSLSRERNKACQSPCETLPKHGG